MNAAFRWGMHGFKNKNKRWNALAAINFNEKISVKIFPVLV